jgi:hypothetical protein
MKPTLAATFALVIAMTAPLHAAEYFLAPDGGDDLAGTREQPWRTLEKAAREAGPGDVITLLSGSYPGSFSPANSGTADAPIVLRAERPRTVTLVGDGPDTWPVALHDCAHVTVEGLDIIPDPPGRWLRAMNAQHITIRDCLMEGPTDGMPFHVDGCDQVRLLDSTLRESRFNMARFGNSAHVLVEGCSITRAGHSPLQFYPDESVRWVVIRGNVFHCKWGRNFEFFSTRDILFEDNIITNAYHGGSSADPMGKCLFDRGIFRFNRIFRNWGGPVNGSPYRDTLWFRDVRLYNNVFDRNYGFGMMVNSRHPSQVRNIVFANNIFSRNDPYAAGRQLSLTGGPAERVRVLSNCFFGGRAGDSSVIVDHGRGWSVAEAQSSGYIDEHGERFAGNIAADPGYREAEIYHHAPAEDSPLIDAGMPLTRAVGDGEGSTITVEDPHYFFDGFGIEGEVGDLIAVGAPEQTARVVQVDLEDSRLVLDRSLTWSDGDPVSLPWTGEAPDIGAFEHGGGRPGLQIVARPFEAAPGEPVTLRAIAHGDFQPTDFRWQPGDGTEAVGSEVTHAYSEPWDYAVRLRAADTAGREEIAPGYAVVGEPSEGEPLMRSTFDDDDGDWQWRWYHHRPRPSAWEQIDEPDGGGWVRVYAPGDEGGLTMRSYQIEWNVDRYPRVRLRYRVGEGTPIALYLQAFWTPEAGYRRVCVAASPAAEVEPESMVADTVLQDDEQWHEITVDAKLIRERFPQVDYLDAIRFDAAPREDVVEGHWFGLDEVVILPRVPAAE